MSPRWSALTLFVLACSGGGKAHPTDSGPDVPAGCGDGVKSGVEKCDGSDFGTTTCATATAAGWTGTLQCTSLCALDISGCNPPTTNWSNVTMSSNWSTFDVSTLFPGAKGFASSVFDGKYLYFVPNNNGAADGIVTRYDTTGGFGSSSSWETFDTATLSASAKGFIGGAFDGRYVYFIPYNNGTYHGNIARYDTQGGFGSPASWQTFDISTVDPNARGYVRGTFDGRYLYLAPHYNEVGTYHGLTARYDTQGGFTDAAAWQTFDMSTVNASSRGFLGAIFDGRYVYYVPYYNTVSYDGVVTRFDTHGSFTDAAAWSTFDVASVNGNAVGFYSAAFDGKYLYLGQYYDGAVPQYGGFIARYDTTAAFTTAGSWEVFNAQGLDAAARGFVGASFDGRYVFFTSHYDGTSYTGVTARFDTQGAGFTAAGSWSVFNVGSLSASARGFHGMGFDGQYIYLVPQNTEAGAVGTVARFNSKSPGWLPLGWNAWFD